MRDDWQVSVRISFSLSIENGDVPGMMPFATVIHRPYLMIGTSRGFPGGCQPKSRTLDFSKSGR